MHPKKQLLYVSAEDILDEVSGLTVDSLNQTLGEASQLQSPSDPEDMPCMAMGQKVRIWPQ